MGYEAKCSVRVGRSTTEGKALLETDELIFRGGERPLRIPFKSVSAVDAADGRLTITHGDAGAVAVFDLGAQAEKWAERIRSPKGLLDKLGVKPGMRALVAGGGPAFDDGDFARQLAERGAEVATGGRASGAYDLVFLDTEDPRDLARIGPGAERLAPRGALWVVHPKGPASRVKDTDVFAAAKPLGLTYTKVAKFSETHTAEKLVRAKS
jgi:hypothetical protein